VRIRDHAKGRWPEIVSALLGEQYANPRKNGPCPNGEGTDRYRFSDKSGFGNFFCGCSQGDQDGFKLLMCVKGWSFAEAALAIESIIGKCPLDDEVRATKRPGIVERISAMAKPASRSRYLESRGLRMAPGLRFVQELDYYDSDGRRIDAFPAMVAPVMREGQLLTWHCTWLKDGAKAPVTPARKVMPGPSLAGASVELYPPAELMGVGEGIETCIAAHQLFSGVPVWAALNTALMKTWEPPPVAKQIIIFADNDPHFAGHAAAYALAHRLVMRGLPASVEFPGGHKDWNDVLLATRGAA
jgi:putative DNA primase/helicase